MGSPKENLGISYSIRGKFIPSTGAKLRRGKVVGIEFSIMRFRRIDFFFHFVPYFLRVYRLDVTPATSFGIRCVSLTWHFIYTQVRAREIVHDIGPRDRCTSRVARPDTVLWRFYRSRPMQNDVGLSRSAAENLPCPALLMRSWHFFIIILGVIKVRFREKIFERRDEYRSQMEGYVIPRHAYK